LGGAPHRPTDVDEIVGDHAQPDPMLHSGTAFRGDGGSPMRWLDNDPMAVVVLIFGIGAISLLALGI
jgi:hypothetical protein